ncbi:DUF2663 family protein [Priestia flexa]|uniref:DUF2663 family protein n=1 Tax=Priestia flexa TaxID=86664 RepID=UPI0009C223C0|nr:DUF2663 family protein [Priestia flexa]AQX53886.1 hypothetical protein BC359_05950 [Priestia flexa]
MKELSHYHVDEPTQYILESVINKKEKLSATQKSMNKWKWVFFVCLLFGISYLFVFTSRLNLIAFSDFIQFFLDDSKHLLLLIIIFSTYFRMIQMQKQCDKVEKEFNDLRCEIIQKSKDIWSTPAQWESRKDLYAAMKQTYDINLYHENK